MAARTRSRGSGDGIDGAVLETGLGSTGAVLETDAPETGRRRPDVGSAASGAGAIEPRASRAQEGLPRCRTAGEASGGTRADFEFCARWRAASVADGDAPKVSTNAKPGTVAKPTGVSVGRSTHQVVQLRLESAGRQCAAHAESAG